MICSGSNHDNVIFNKQGWQENATLTYFKTYAFETTDQINEFLLYVLKEKNGANVRIQITPDYDNNVVNVSLYCKKEQLSDAKFIIKKINGKYKKYGHTS